MIEAAAPVLKNRSPNARRRFTSRPRTVQRQHFDQAQLCHRHALVRRGPQRGAHAGRLGQRRRAVHLRLGTAHYLKQHNALPKRTLVAAMPVSLREESNKDLNNQASMVLAELGTNHGDAAVRWQAILTSTGKIKESLKA